MYECINLFTAMYFVSKQAALNILKLLSELDQQSNERTANGPMTRSVSNVKKGLIKFVQYDTIHGLCRCLSKAFKKKIVCVSGSFF